jgi:hypothetical protein
MRQGGSLLLYVVGDSVFDIPRFILNEFDDVIDDTSYEKIQYIIQTLTDKLEVDEFDIRRLVYMETCMAHCWCVESNEEPNMNEVLLAEKLMESSE